MKPRSLALLIGGALLAYALYATYLERSQTPQPASDAKPAPVKSPKPVAPKKPRCPNCPQFMAEQAPSAPSRRPQLGGIDSPDGAAHILPLPDGIKWPKNIASKGLGLCTFRSLDYAARWQNVPALADLPERMRQDGVPGGGFPEKVDRIMSKYGDGTPYWNDTSKSWELLAAALASQRIACVDYSGRDPHYNGPIAHCVCVVCCDLAAGWVAILDNNYPALDEIVWMGVDEFSKRWNGWCYGLLAQTPGYCAGQCSEEKWTFAVENDGAINFGLETARFPAAGSAVLNGEPSTVDAIIAEIGPEMAPIRVNVDHKMEPISVKIDPLTCALAGGAVLMFYVLSRREGSQ